MLGEQASTNKDCNKIICLLELLAAGYRARSASHPEGVYMDRLRGSGPQHPRDPAVSKPSQDSGKWQEYDEEKGGDSCSLADSGRHHFSRHCDQEQRTWHAHCDDRHDRRQSEGFLRRRVFDQCVSSETIQPQEGPTCKAQEKWID